MNLPTHEILREFSFNDEDDLLTWGSSFDRDYRFNLTLSAVLYTDGDGGIMLLSWPETCEEKGVCISLVECSYCDIKIKTIKKIHKALKKSWRNDWCPKRF
jgi:hypothetical protein